MLKQVSQYHNPINLDQLTQVRVSTSWYFIQVIQIIRLSGLLTFSHLWKTASHLGGFLLSLKTPSFLFHLISSKELMHAVATRT